MAAMAGLAAAVIAWWPGSTQPASADFPHAGVGFSIGAGSTCNSTAGPMKCTFEPNDTFTLDFRVDSLGEGFAYGGYDASINYAGVTVKEATLVQTGAGVWPGCVFNAFDFSEAGHIAAACAFGIGAQPSTYTGVMMHVDFNCVASGTVTLLQGEGASDLVDDNLVPHGEASGSEVLTINCGAEPPPSPTPCDGPCPTATPTNTQPPQPTATPTRTPAPKACGDVNDDGSINPVDAQLILQQSAGLLASLPNAPSADVNYDGTVNPIDATLILQHSAGLLPASALDCG
jgi:hypothetical protein